MDNRMVATLGVDINRPADEVFDYLRDVHRHNEWSPKPYRVEGIEGLVDAGSKFVSYGWLPGKPDNRNDVEVTAFEPGRKIEFTATQDGHKFLNTFVLTPNGDKTRVEKTIDFYKPGGFAGMVVMPILFPALIKPATQKAMVMLKDQLEA